MGKRFLQYIQQDIKLFLYLECLMMVFRIAFIAIYAGQLNTVEWREIGYALWVGVRISLKTAAFLTAFSWVFATICGSIWKRWPAETITFDCGKYRVGTFGIAFYDSHSLLSGVSCYL